MPEHVVRKSLAQRVRALQGPGEVRRVLIGIVGPPGAGKSTIAADVAAEIGDGVTVLPMDGFHLAGRELERRGLAGRKGAPDTFDVSGFVAALRRVRHEAGQVVYLPEFDRTIEEPVAGAIPVEPSTTYVLVEGNYLLLAEGGWAAVRDLLDEVWYLDVDPDVRRQRLVERHVRYGRSPRAAAKWMETVDEPNAELIGRSRSRADVVISLDHDPQQEAG